MIVKVAFVIGRGGTTTLMIYEAFWYNTKDMICTTMETIEDGIYMGCFELDTTQIF